MGVYEPIKEKAGRRPARSPVNAWLYQTKLSVKAGGAEVFLPVTEALMDIRFERDDELRRLQLQYRDRLEFAIGRTCSVDWTVAGGARRGRLAIDSHGVELGDNKATTIHALAAVRAAGADASGDLTGRPATRGP